MLDEDITRDIVGAAMAVLNELKPGLDEKLNITGLEVALLLNIKEAKLPWKRVIRERARQTADDKDSADRGINPSTQSA